MKIFSYKIWNSERIFSIVKENGGNEPIHANLTEY